ncbi:hypothetical protein CRE_18237 [Caenorhabditis remanei]|uniref:Uncharacterized protein n=1 Tax=Caenorhabditis remanei TaxID=31234 RepID=E3NFI7_CAERE|nr:hypothetical protein CRE_18237 [Caenorhabditis remanei]
MLLDFKRPNRIKQTSIINTGSRSRRVFTAADSREVFLRKLFCGTSNNREVQYSTRRLETLLNWEEALPKLLLNKHRRRTNLELAEAWLEQLTCSKYHEVIKRNAQLEDSKSGNDVKFEELFRMFHPNLVVQFWQHPEKHQGDTSHDLSTQSYCHKATGEYAKLETTIFESGFEFKMVVRRSNEKYGRGLLAIKRVVHSKYKDINRKKCKWELSETHPDDAKNTCQDNHLKASTKETCETGDKNSGTLGKCAQLEPPTFESHLEFKMMSKLSSSNRVSF